jgi:1-acyl-sn-glycerol-3-phosphate acyltransferase
VLRFLFVTTCVIPVTVYNGFRMLWAVRRNPPTAKCICDRVPRRWASFILRCSGVRVILENEEVIDPERPQIVVANHVSWFDVFTLIAAMPGRSLFVAKKELSRIPLFGPAVAACGHVFIDRTDRRRAVDSLAVVRKKLEEDCSTIIMFPEGTRSRTGELQPFKKGAFVLAIQAGVEVVPAAISGSRSVMRKGSMRIRPGTIRVRFGDPIEVSGLDLDMRNELTKRAHNALAALQEQSAQ